MKVWLFSLWNCPCNWHAIDFKLINLVNKPLTLNWTWSKLSYYPPIWGGGCDILSTYLWWYMWHLSLYLRWDVTYCHSISGGMWHIVPLYQVRYVTYCPPISGGICDILSPYIRWDMWHIVPLSQVRYVTYCPPISGGICDILSPYLTDWFKFSGGMWHIVPLSRGGGGTLFATALQVSTAFITQAFSQPTVQVDWHFPDTM